MIHKPLLKPVFSAGAPEKNILLGYWPFEETSGDALDVHNGSGAYDFSIIFQQAGVVNKCFRYNGTSSCLWLYDNPNIDFSTNIAVSFWIKPEANSGGILGFGSKKEGDWYIDIDSNNRVIFRIQSTFSFSYVASPNASITLNVCQHIAITYNHGTTAIYIDGNLAASKNIASSRAQLPSEAPKIGYSQYEGYYKGFIDEFAFFSTLTPDNINWLYNNGNGRTYTEI